MATSACFQPTSDLSRPQAAGTGDGALVSSQQPLSIDTPGGTAATGEPCHFPGAEPGQQAVHQGRGGRAGPRAPAAGDQGQASMSPGVLAGSCTCRKLNPGAPQVSTAPGEKGEQAASAGEEPQAARRQQDARPRLTCGPAELLKVRARPRETAPKRPEAPRHPDWARPPEERSQGLR